jgi:hypothetical protein
MKMWTKIAAIATILVFFFGTTLKGQEEKVPGTSEAEVGDEENGVFVGADFVSRYVWRGTDYGNSPAIQPSLYFSWNGLCVGAWGSYSFSNYSYALNDSITVDAGKYSEFDLYISYTYKWFTLLLYDYFTANGMNPNEGNNYFDLKNSTTSHTLEASLIFEGPEKFPLKFTASTLIYGADKNQDENGEYGYGTKNNFSTYLELEYKFHVAKNFMDLSPFIGGSLFGSSWYGSKPGIINLGLSASKEIPVTERFSIPVKLSVVANPVAQSTFLIFAVSL